MLALLCPAFPTPTETETYKEFMQGDFSILTPRNSGDFKNTIKKSCYTRIDKIMPSMISNAYVNFFFTEDKTNLFSEGII
jgi:hypothetical protein